MEGTGAGICPSPQVVFARSVFPLNHAAMKQPFREYLKGRELFFRVLFGSSGRSAQNFV
jgi:hypothetical protein